MGLYRSKNHSPAIPPSEEQILNLTSDLEEHPAKSNMRSGIQIEVEQKIPEEFEASSETEQNKDIPLAISLNALLQELCTIQHEGKVWSPRKVMPAMAVYTPSFNLTSQQINQKMLKS
ncbi:hypothetical protein L1887_09400 [Cichorium endivia]|nr:hypothetical protein L1887_09400 [Cichorium endivia]